MSIITTRDDAVKAGGCSACNEPVLSEPPWTYGRVLVIDLRPGSQGGTQIRLCSSCEAEMRKALR